MQSRTKAAHPFIYGIERSLTFPHQRHDSVRYDSGGSGFAMARFGSVREKRSDVFE
jgi:hypothetical protein